MHVTVYNDFRFLEFKRLSRSGRDSIDTISISRGLLTLFPLQVLALILMKRTPTTEYVALAPRAVGLFHSAMRR